MFIKIADFVLTAYGFVLLIGVPIFVIGGAISASIHKK